MKDILFVGLGGFLGSIIRYKISGFFLHMYANAKFPWGTFFVNLFGCLLIGIIAGVAEKYLYFTNQMRIFLITGFLGGFTTFSAFGFESMYLFKRGDTLLAFSYIIGSVVLGIFFVWLGFKVFE
ncbi:MAG: hypothetical protein ACD_79C01035G0003 [uncultured bacterium]|nr:MAG: hypothetical protein ACD_79C01035G0003 [uncultured bacterium]